MDRSSSTRLRLLFPVGILVLSAISGVREANPQDRRPFAPAPARETPNREGRSSSPFGGSGNQFGFSGRATVEEYNRLLVDQLFQVTGERDVPDRKKSFDPKEWPGVERLIRVEHPAVPILGKRAWNSPTIDISGVADAGEILALVNIDNIVALVNPLGQHPDESGTWYQVRLLDGKEGWIFAVPNGREASPFARAFRNENGELTELADARSAKADSNAGGAGTAPHVVEASRSRGADAGYKDGLRAGDAEGFEAGFKDGQETSYRQTLSERYSTGDYRLVPGYSLLVLAIAFLLGFGLQYVMLYLLRTGGILCDIDGIVLPSRATALNLRDLAEQGQRTSSTQEQTNLLRSEPD